MDALIFERIKKLFDSSGLLNSNNPIINQNDCQNFSDEIILITGAAGSIGSGLAHQLLHCKFKKLILIDTAETPLFFLKRDVEAKNIKNIEFILGDIKDNPHMLHIFNMHRPTLIFHTAAYKHVSIVEKNPFEAIKTNIFATKLLAELAIRYNSKRFIFISTDKAVNPVGIMGMTKCIAENYLSSLNEGSTATTFISARFGNIFGSNGSVVPLFIKQLNSGQPITITDKEATRLFIDKHKACNLILKLATLDVFNHSKVSFDMGHPIKIKDIAEVLTSIFRSKSENIEATKIKISKLSQGEKLHERIVNDNETLMPSEEKSIFFIENKIQKETSTNLIKLEGINNTTQPDKIREILLELCKS